MTGIRKTRIIAIKNERNIEEFAEKKIKPIVENSSLEDSIKFMAGEKEQDEKDVLINRESGLSFAKLSDDEVKLLESTGDVVAIEGDDEVELLNEDGYYEEEEGRDYDLLVDPVQNASLEIEAIQKRLEEEGLLSDSEISLGMKLAGTATPPADDYIDFDENGNLVDLSHLADTQRIHHLGSISNAPNDMLSKIKLLLEEVRHGDSGAIPLSIDGLLAKYGLTEQLSNSTANLDYVGYGIRQIFADQAWQYSKGAGVNVAILDTGADAGHRDLRISGGISFVPGVASWADDEGHGTHVAGIVGAVDNGSGVIGVAPDANIFAVKVLGGGKPSSIIVILNGLLWAARNNMHVVNLSLGKPAKCHDPKKYSLSYDRVGKLLRRKGIVSIVAAGNHGAKTNSFVTDPGRSPSFMAVAAVDSERKRAPFSSFGPQVEIAAPGVKIWSTYPQNSYRQLSGTSMAAPFVAGAAALIKSRYPSMHGDEIRRRLYRSATDLGMAGRDWFAGYGLVNALRAIR